MRTLGEEFGTNLQKKFQKYLQKHKKACSLTYICNTYYVYKDKGVLYYVTGKALNPWYSINDKKMSRDDTNLILNHT